MIFIISMTKYLDIIPPFDYQSSLFRGRTEIKQIMDRNTVHRLPYPHRYPLYLTAHFTGSDQRRGLTGPTKAVQVRLRASQGKWIRCTRRFLC